VDPGLEDNHQHMSGQVLIKAEEVFRLPLYYTSFGQTSIEDHLVWDFQMQVGSEISFGILYQVFFIFFYFYLFF